MKTSTHKLMLAGLAALALVSCAKSDPREENLEKAVRLAETIVTSRILIDAVHNADPAMHASTAASAAFSGGITSNFQLPPENIGMEAAAQPSQPWYVIVKGDDAQHQVIIEGYGDSLTKPLITKVVNFPPN
ncbi:MAG: hypothetical protein PHU06_12925 [Gallionella sp.]|nr:hypothetical protein [Gallionella sp.]MDD4959663.1 hypothetical protein [Gallionella sp.]